MRNFILLKLVFFICHFSFAQDCIEFNVHLFFDSKFASIPNSVNQVDDNYIAVEKFFNSYPLLVDFHFKLKTVAELREPWTEELEISKQLKGFQDYISGLAKDSSDIFLFMTTNGTGSTAATFLGYEPCSKSQFGIQVIRNVNPSLIQLSMARMICRNFRVATDSTNGYLMSDWNPAMILSPQSLNSINTYLKDFIRCTNESSGCLFTTHVSSNKLNKQEITIAENFIENEAGKNISIIDISGQMILKSKSQHIQLESIMPGVYFIFVENRMVRKFIKI